MRKKLHIKTLAVLALVLAGLLWTIKPQRYFNLRWVTHWGREGAERVEQARNNQEQAIRRGFAEKGLTYPPGQVVLINFKAEKTLELWAADGPSDRLTRIKSYEVRKSPGKLGPKRKEHDRQVPEGVYLIDRFNPESRFHLSLGLDYPNSLDRALADPQTPGGDIFIHGGSGSDGCIPIGDEAIEEVYLICLDSKARSGTSPRVLGFPCRMDTPACQYDLDRRASQSPELKNFWAALGRVYSYFIRNRTAPLVTIGPEGSWIVSDREGKEWREGPALLKRPESR